MSSTTEYGFFLLLYCFHLCLFFFLTAVDAQLDNVGLDFVKNSISAIEKRGKFKTYHYLTHTTRTYFFSGSTWEP